MIRTKAVFKYQGYILLFNALLLTISTAVSYYHNESSINALLITSILTTTLGILPLIFFRKVVEVTFHEGLMISILGWFITCIVGAIPYLLYGGEFTLANALFESVSGYTTTGASILSDVEVLPKGLLFWRSSTTFIGGVGIILFVLLVMPAKKGVLTNLYRSEVSDLSKMNFRNRSKHIIRIIITVYFSLIIAETILLKLLGMSFFDAICHSFSTVATAGFSTKNLSIAAYDNVWIETIVMLFMLVSSMHFGLLYATISRQKMNIFTSHHARMYLVVIFVGIALVALQLTHVNMYDWGQSLRYASFQVISLASTTGLATVDTAKWPIFSIILLLYYSVQCGMVGSTSGGIKFERIYIFFKSVIKQLKLIIHPDGVYAVRVDKMIIDHGLELQVMIFIIVYLFTMMITTVLLAAMGIDGITALSASIATIGNVGPGFGEVSSLGNYGNMPIAAKYILSANMLLGRLEIMNVLALFLLMSRKN